ncbi:ABC-type transport auxiliary lipoprotein family protein [Guyparkeria sp.]|uniref:ABC-type transport auxiliary lipoprotein family protein n=1 Tax=Guyparkeria sp. TaxID=2035736 RepID=UPI00356589F9
MAGCASLPERGQEPGQWRFLPAGETSAPLADDRRVVLRLVETRAASGIDRRDMAYSTDQQSIAYYRDNRWAASPAVMLNEVIDETLTAQPWVRGVVRGGARVPADLGLYCEINRLEHVIEADAGRVEVRVACSWSRAAERVLVHSMVFNEQVEIDQNDAAHYARGTQELVNVLLAQLVRDGRELAARAISSKGAIPD